MNTFFKYILICLLVVSPRLSAQIVSVGHTATENSEYSENDKLYFYTDSAAAELSAATHAGTNITYTWEKYDIDNGSWINSITSNNPDFPNTTIEDGAYRVTVNDNGVVVRQDVCWTFVPRILTLEVETIVSDCFNLQLTANTTTKPLNYVNPANGDSSSVNYQLSYEWTSDPASDASTETVARPTMDAPTEPITYTVKAIAFNGAHSLEADFVYDEPIAVKADFTFDVTDRGNKNELPVNTKFTGLTEYTGSSEISVSLNDSSKGFIDSYTIEIENESGINVGLDLQLLDKTFKELGTYKMFVTVKNSNSECSDKQELGPIKIEEIYLELPNVFTPDGDGTNDEFMAVYTSIKEFKMIVFNRWGRKVFQTSDPGEAWDGKIGGKDAAEGVYFYVVTAKGYNKGEERKREGPVHLLRGK